MSLLVKLRRDFSMRLYMILQECLPTALSTRFSMPGFSSWLSPRNRKFNSDTPYTATLFLETVRFKLPSQSLHTLQDITLYDFRALQLVTLMYSYFVTLPRQTCYYRSWRIKQHDEGMSCKGGIFVPHQTPRK
jgi:hypothetical protein